VHVPAPVRGSRPRARLAFVSAALAGLLIVAGAACKGDGKAAPRNTAADGARPSTQVDDGDDQSQFDRERQPGIILRALELEPGMVVADIGAGTGLLTAHLARAVSPGGHVVATDIDASVIEYLTSRMAAGGYEHVVEPRVVKPDDPGLEPGRFDAINLAQVDHYFDDRVAWLKKAAPALKPGGKLAISNRQVHRNAAVAAAEQAGFRLVTEISDVPGQFVAVFEVAPPSPPKAPR
jgi:SAM-dependent methyltransferase